jgi:16S rRNA C967 or C1407 C5-methylase (RsmB/RsmF family)
MQATVTRESGKRGPALAEATATGTALTPTAALRQLENSAWASYYQQQLCLAATSDEWRAFEGCLREPLPVTWRFSGDDAGARALRDAMERTVLPALVEQQPMPLAWYPARLAWQAGVSRAALRGKDWADADAPGAAGRSAAVKALHAWLLRETELGRVQRQESVSMVPPLLLDIRPGHHVLDMCASPGSKTQQLLEALDGRGLVLANDADTKRCQLLASRASRLHSTALLVTNHDARMLPETLEEGGGAGDGAGGVPLQFDRVLADVPCSGDGTMRKNPLIWKRWTAAPGNALHSLQLQIACKGVRLLKVGGRLVYSTCSLNPIENEAVVAAVLRTFGTGCVRLVDVRAQLEGLPRRPGLSSWSVWHRGQMHASWAELRARIWEGTPALESCFPPSAEERRGGAAGAGDEGGADGGGGVDGGAHEGAHADGFHLERCLRLMPHELNGSGFFVAVFEKLALHAEAAGQLPKATPELCVADDEAFASAVLRSEADLPLGGERGLLVAGGPAAAAVAKEASAAAAAAKEAATEAAAAAATEAAAAAATEAAAAAATAEAAAAAAAAAEAEAAAGLAALPCAPPAGRTRLGRYYPLPEEAAAQYAACARHQEVLHAYGGATVEAAVAAVTGTAYAPLFVPDARALRALAAFFGLRDDFPTDRILARSPQAKVLLLVSAAVKRLLRADTRGVLRVVHCGVRTFEHEGAKGCAVECGYRACQDALPLYLSSLSKQRVDIRPATAARLLRCPTSAAAISAEELQQHEPELLEALRATCQPGSVVLSCIGDDGLPLHLAALYAPSGALGARVNALERQALLSRLSV